MLADHDGGRTDIQTHWCECLVVYCEQLVSGTMVEPPDLLFGLQRILVTNTQHWAAFLAEIAFIFASSSKKHEPLSSSVLESNQFGWRVYSDITNAAAWFFICKPCYGPWSPIIDNKFNK